MKKCINCKKDYGNILITITDENSSVNYCPNCLVAAWFNGLDFTNSEELVDEITGKKGAVKFSTFGEEYVLERKTMLRLISHNLFPFEHKFLVEKHGWDKYMLHDDFYDENHIAIQPCGEF